VIAVPGCYLIFNKLERPLLALLAIPLFAVVLGGAIWWLGMAVSAKPVHLNWIGVVSFAGDTTPAGIKVFGVSVGSGSDSYNLTIDNQHSSDQGAVYRPQNLVIPNQQWRTSPPLMFTQDLQPSAGIIQSNSNPDGQLQAFGGQGSIEGHLPVETNLAVLPDGSGLSGTILNTSSWNLNDVILVLGDNYLYLGNLAASELRQVNFPLKVKPNFLPRVSIETGLYGSSPITNTSTGTVSNDTPDRWRRNLRWTMLNSVYLNGRFSALYQSYNLYLTGWLEGSAATDLMGSVNLDQGHALRQQDSVLIE